MNGTEAATTSPELIVWLVLAAIVLVGVILAQGISYATWTLMRKNAPLAARIGWLIAIVAALGCVTWYWYPYHLLCDAPNTVLVGQGVGLLVVLVIFILTYRRRSA